MTDKPAAGVTPRRINPEIRPARPYFSSGPCAKPPGWSPDKLNLQSLGRSHRSKSGKARLAYCIALMREMLELPETHRIGIVPGSDTGAFEMAMWSMLGARRVTCLAWESFGEGWVTDAVKQLKLDPTVIRADYGELPDLAQIGQLAIIGAHHGRFDLELLDRVGHPAFAEAFPGEGGDRPSAKHRPHGHLERAGVGRGNDADAMRAGKL